MDLHRWFALLFRTLQSQGRTHPVCTWQHHSRRMPTSRPCDSFTSAFCIGRPMPANFLHGLSCDSFFRRQFLLSCCIQMILFGRSLNHHCPSDDHQACSSNETNLQHLVAHHHPAELVCGHLVFSRRCLDHQQFFSLFRRKYCQLPFWSGCLDWVSHRSIPCFPGRLTCSLSPISLLHSSYEISSGSFQHRHS